MAYIHSTVQEVEVLQAKLQVAEDEDEQRTLEEDMTGKILWFYWCGIRSEVDQILAIVVNCIRTGVAGTGLSPRWREISEIIKRTRTSHANPDEDTIHLRRLMHDAAPVYRNINYGLMPGLRKVSCRGLKEVIPFLPPRGYFRALKCPPPRLFGKHRTMTMEIVSSA
ncbi:hypothetical protein EDD16DRAFT_120869 [Pisolithus croceorrhizus]|nr:hypothetical protein EDD16DRAFT_120869 [Pisolithus croceorrhizus]KAI6134431.1 hypothetical protein EV401DRAFT_1363475 [Pisolithus croceorrhizus]KAI6167810.1 hypothetical protein EDD17DRAFT_863883 [Pisolithus thermaeus]